MSSFIKRTKETLPSSRSGHALLNDNKNKNIYIVGGYNEDGPLDDIYRYDCNINKWTKLITPLTKAASKIVKNDYISPLPRLEFDCCLTSTDLSTNIYLFGGVQNIDDQILIYNDLWCYDSNKLTWVCISEETPVAERSGHVMLSISSNHFIINGGECLGKWFDDTWLYDIQQKKWYQVGLNGLKPIPRSSHSIVYCEDTNIIVLFGGVTSSPNSQQEMIQLNDLWILDMKTNNNPKEWIWQMVSLSGIAPSPRDLPALMSLGNGKIMIMGGYGLEEVDIEEVDDDEEMDSDDADEDLLDNNIVDDIIDNGHDMTSENVIIQKDSVSVDDLNITGMTLSNDIIQSNELQLDGDNDDEDNDIEGAVEITYLDDCWILDINTRTSVEVDLDESITNGMTVIPRRGMKITRIKDDVKDLIITFGGFDGSSFYGITETIDVSKLL